VLYIAPTPIGNLRDITLRALETLKEVDAVFCEDTRRTLKLLSHFGISKKIFRYNEHDVKSISNAISWLKSGKSAALVTDGGTPCISDPGYKLIAMARQCGIKIISLPGPSSVTAAAAGCGLPVDSFIFLGFLPRSSGKAKRILDNALSLKKTVILFESPYRLKKFVSLLNEWFNRKLSIVIAREISKIYEEWLVGSPADIIAAIEKLPEIKGEAVVILRLRTDTETSTAQCLTAF